MSSNDIISRLGTRFVKDTTGGRSEGPDPLTRDIGGQFRDNQPYISGYFQIMFGLPGYLFTNAFGGPDAGAASKWLHTTCEGFTPHTETLNLVDVMGQGQLGSSFPASKTLTREFTCTFREYQNMPVIGVIKSWGAIFDSFTGVSPIDAVSFVPSSYKGWAAIVQTRPTGSGNPDEGGLVEDAVEECYLYQGVVPTNIPIDTASATDITGNDTIQLSVTFRFDGAPLTKAEGIIPKVIALFNDYKYIGKDSSTFEKYEKLGKSTLPNPV